MTNNSDGTGLPFTNTDGLSDARRNWDALLALVVSQDVRPGQVGGILDVAAGRADQFAGELAVVVTAETAMLRAVGGRDHAGDVIASVTEGQLEDWNLDKVAGTNLADDNVLDDVVLVGQGVGLVVFNLDDLVVSLNFDSASDGVQFEGVATGVDFDGQGKRWASGLLGEDCVARSGRAVGRDESVAGGQISVHGDIVESDNGLGGNVANADETSLDGEHLRHGQTGVAQSHAQVLEDIDVLVVAVHHIGVNMQINIVFVNVHLQFNVTGTDDLLGSGSRAMRGMHAPVGQQRGLKHGVDTGESHLTTGRQVGVVDVQNVATGSGVVQDSFVTSLGHWANDTRAAGIIAVQITAIIRIGVAAGGGFTLSFSDVTLDLDQNGGDVLGVGLRALVGRSLTPDEGNFTLNGGLNSRRGLENVLGKISPGGLDVDAKGAAGSIQFRDGKTGNLDSDL